MAGLVRRKLKITDQPEDAEEILAEEARSEETKSERKDHLIRQNAKDLGLLQAVMKSNQPNASTAAVNGSTSAVNASDSGRTSGTEFHPSGPSTIVGAFESVAQRTIAQASQGLGLKGSTEKKQEERNRDEIPALRAPVADGALAVEESDSEDDDIEDNA